MKQIPLPERVFTAGEEPISERKLTSCATRCLEGSFPHADPVVLIESDSESDSGCYDSQAVEEQEREVIPPPLVFIRYCVNQAHARELDGEAKVSNYKHKPLENICVLIIILPVSSSSSIKVTMLK
ncbi:hypothetical protein Bca4012_036002 [Brassica carinata]